MLSHVTDHTNPPRKGDAGWAAPRFGVRVLTAVARIPVTVVRRRCCRTRDALYGVVLRSVLRSPEGVAEAVPRPRNGIGMAMQIAGHAWVLVAPKAALVRRERLWTEVPDGFALLEVLGCGVCHTDLGFADGEVAPKQELPLVLGHEVVGRVLAVGAGGAQTLLGKRILAPAVSPCGVCATCRRVGDCAKGRMPGNDADGGFATHCLIPARDLAVLDAEPGQTGRLGKAGLEAWELAPIADAGTTAWQAIVRSGLGAGDVAVFVGTGGVGGFGVQLAAARGAHVVGLDVDDRRLEALGGTLAHSVNVKGREAREVRDSIRAFIKAKGLRDSVLRVFETSGTTAGQALAFQPLDRAGTFPSWIHTEKASPDSNVMAPMPTFRQLGLRSCAVQGSS